MRRAFPLLLAASSSALIACSDEEPPAPTPVVVTPVPQACDTLAPGDGELAGEYFLALAPVPESPTDPFLFLSTFNVSGGATQVTLTPLDRNDRVTATGTTQILGPFPFETDGTIVATLENVVVPPRTNPLAEAQVVGDFTLTGGFCEDPRTLVCGTFTGQLTAPEPRELAGTWAADRIDGGETDFVVNCDGDAGTAP